MFSASPRCRCSFFLILLGMILTYLVLVEIAKARFYAYQPHPTRTTPTPDERRARHVRRRAYRFIRHVGPGRDPVASTQTRGNLRS